MITQKDMARKLGISRSLVSRALTGTAADIGASEETVLKIRRMAEKCGYVQNAAALSLRGDSSMTVGVAVKDFTDPFFGKMIGEIQSLGRERGFSLLLTGYSEGGNPQVDINSLLRYHPDALIICGSHVDLYWLKSFIAKGIPAVQIGAGKTYAGLSRVEMDEEYGMSLLLNHLKSLGHREIGFIGTDSEPSLNRKRILAKFATRMGISLKLSNSISVKDQADAGFNAMEFLLQRAGKNLPSAVVAADDFTAQGALKALHEDGLSVPKDISLTGVDDIPAASLTIPALTTIRSPITEMVQAAFSLAVDKAANTRKPKSLKLKPELIIRASTVKNNHVNPVILSKIL
ncbi:MAG TPA: hypothetical protein DCZ94_21850 [Lentisphaeria bacterium]|nr:MAG: hypothetical protein A2X48_19305 [Lentisphaerae bacterium GWF2_49_21]HBC89590.1 hypothetical protein [Lentisphaeria bacterium]